MAKTNADSKDKVDEVQPESVQEAPQAAKEESPQVDQQPNESVEVSVPEVEVVSVNVKGDLTVSPPNAPDFVVPENESVKVDLNVYKSLGLNDLLALKEND